MLHRNKQTSVLLYSNERRLLWEDKTPHFSVLIKKRLSSDESLLLAISSLCKIFVAICQKDCTWTSWFFIYNNVPYTTFSTYFYSYSTYFYSWIFCLFHVLLDSVGKQHSHIHDDHYFFNQVTCSDISTSMAFRFWSWGWRCSYV